MEEVGVPTLQKDFLYSWLCQTAGKIHSGIVIVEANSFTIEYVNSIFSTITGYMKDEILGQKITILDGTQTEKQSEDVLKK